MAAGRCWCWCCASQVVEAELESTKARLEEVDDIQTIYDIMCYAEQRQAEAMVSTWLSKSS